MKFEIKKGMFFNTLNLIQKNKNSLLYVVLLDIIFVIALLMLVKIFAKISNSAIASQQSFQLLALAIIYYLAILFVYSFFKYVVLHLIKSGFSKSKLEFKNLGNFFLLNITLFIILLLVFFALSLIASGIKEGISPFVSLIILLLYFIFAYAFVNLNHVLFSEGKSLTKSLQIALKNFGKLKIYYGVYAVILAAIAIIILVFSIFGNFLKYTFFQDYNALIQYGDAYTIIFVHSLGIIFYLAILFNRFYFYNIVKEKIIK